MTRLLFARIQVYLILAACEHVPRREMDARWAVDDARRAGMGLPQLEADRRRIGAWRSCRRGRQRARPSHRRQGFVVERAIAARLGEIGERHRAAAVEREAHRGDADCAALARRLWIAHRSPRSSPAARCDRRRVRPRRALTPRRWSGRPRRTAAPAARGGRRRAPPAAWRPLSVRRAGRPARRRNRPRAARTPIATAAKPAPARRRPAWPRTPGRASAAQAAPHRTLRRRQRTSPPPESRLRKSPTVWARRRLGGVCRNRRRSVRPSWRGRRRIVTQIRSSARRFGVWRGRRRRRFAARRHQFDGDRVRLAGRLRRAEAQGCGDDDRGVHGQRDQRGEPRTAARRRGRQLSLAARRRLQARVARDRRRSRARPTAVVDRRRLPHAAVQVLSLSAPWM